MTTKKIFRTAKPVKTVVVESTETFGVVVAAGKETIETV